MLFLYQRVSTLEQAGEGKTSLEEQERIGRGYAMAKGFNQFDVSCYCDAGVSASIPLRKRPAGSRMLEDIKSGDTVFASKLDRMFRSANDALTMSEIFLEKNIKLVLFDLGSDPINSSGISQFFLTVIAAVAQLERTMIRERLTGGKKAKKEKGGHIGGLVPYGFRKVGTGRAAALEELPEEKAILDKLTDWFRNRASMSVAEQTRLLTEEGITARNGKPFHPRQVLRLVERVRHDNPL